MRFAGIAIGVGVIAFLIFYFFILDHLPPKVAFWIGWLLGWLSNTFWPF